MPSTASGASCFQFRPLQHAELEHRCPVARAYSPCRSKTRIRADAYVAGSESESSSLATVVDLPAPVLPNTAACRVISGFTPISAAIDSALAIEPILTERPGSAPRP